MNHLKDGYFYITIIIKIIRELVFPFIALGLGVGWAITVIFMCLSAIHPEDEIVATTLAYIPGNATFTVSEYIKWEYDCFVWILGRLAETVPFDGFLSNIFHTDSEILESFLGFWGDITHNNPSPAWQAYAPTLLRELALISVADRLIAINGKVANKIRETKIFLLKFVSHIIFFSWLLACYCIADCGITLLERIVPSAICLYWVLLFITNGIWIAMLEKKSIIPAIVVVVVNILFSAIRAVLTWFWITHAPTTWSLNNFEQFMSSLIVVILVHGLLQNLEYDTRHGLVNLLRRP